MNNAEQLKTTIDCFWDTIPQLWGRVRGDIRSRAVRNFNLTLRQFHILRHIRKGFHSVSALAEHQQISRPAVSQALNQLVEKGLVTRNGMQQDRRRIHLALTAQGEQLLDCIFEQNRDWMERQMADLDTAQLDILIKALDILQTTFGQEGT